MARFLVGSTALMGHIVPLAPIVAELVRRGHEVRWYTGRDYQERVEATGAVFHPPRFAPDLHGKTVGERFPERARLTGIRSLLFDIENLFLAPAVGQTLDLQEMLRTFPADAMLSDAAFLATSWAHELGGPPWAALNPFAITLSGANIPPFGLGVPPATSMPDRLRVGFLKLLGRHLYYRKSTRLADRLRRRLGLPPTGQLFWDRALSPFLYMQGSVRGLEYLRDDLPPQFHFVGPTVSHRDPVPFEPPEWWGSLGDGRPVVHVTQGTLSNDPRRLILPTLRALAGERVLTVATTGDSSVKIPEQAIPENAVVEAFIPYDHLLPRVDVMVTNGGYNGVQLALSRGVPLVLAGATEDKLETNARVVWAGAGIDLGGSSPSESRIRAAVRRVLDDGRYRARAGELAREFQSQDGPAVAAGLLEQLARTGQPVIRSAS
jgi:MGT family glycosyltransferase